MVTGTDRTPEPPEDGVVAALEQLCSMTASRVALLGVAVTLMPGVGSHVVAASSPTVRHLEDAQFDLGEGPTAEAFRARRLVLVTLEAAGLFRWAGWTPVALASGVGAVGAFPLQVGAAVFGVLTAYSPGRLGADHLVATLRAVDLATDLILDKSLPHDDGRLADDLGDSLDKALDTHAHVYQAQGMVMVDLGVSLAEAMARMRAHAWATGQDLTSLAVDIVAGRTSLPRDRPPTRSTDLHE